VRAITVLLTGLLAATTIVGDPRDAGGKLDLKSARIAPNGSLARVTLSTYGRWASRLLLYSRNGTSGPLPGRNKLTVLYDVDGDGRADFTGRIVYKGRLALWITGRNAAYEPVPVSRPTRSSASFVHPVDIFFKNPGRTETVRLAFRSVTGRVVDRMPNRGWIPVVFHF
jgi:hypothetical protein